MNRYSFIPINAAVQMRFCDLFIFSPPSKINDLTVFRMYLTLYLCTNVSLITVEFVKTMIKTRFSGWMEPVWRHTMVSCNYNGRRDAY